VVKLKLTLLVSLLLCACQSTPGTPMNTVPHVDLPRFMGSWFVIGNIPTPIEKHAFNAVESYKLADDGSIETTFTYRKGGFDGKPKAMHPRGFVLDRTSNALWGMQFIWPIKADYRIVFLADDYSQTIIAREKRDYLWIMARTPTMSDTDYQKLVALSQSLGYDVSKIRKVPQDGTTPR
jgi:apolipoprotein D and lipocalin family protein